MKLYVKLLSLTLALMFVFLTGYFSGLFASAEAATRIAAALRIAFLPPFAAFETIWSVVYVTEIIILTSTFSKRMVSLAFSPAPSTRMTVPRPKRSCSMS